MTNEELDKARAEEAYQRFLKTTGTTIRDACDIAARLAREGWTPEPKVDPLVLEARESVKAALDPAAHNSCNCRDDIDAGEWDGKQSMRVALKALKRGMEIAREQDAPSEAVKDCLTTDASEPVQDFGVDEAMLLYASIINPEVPLANPVDALRTALAAAERRGKDKARDWCHRNGMFDYESDFDAKFCRDLLGETK